MSYLLPAFVAVVLIYSAAKKVNVYDSFVEGGKKALKLAYVVFPFVSSVLIMIALFRESGLSEMLTAALEKPLSAVGIPLLWPSFFFCDRFREAAHLPISKPY